MMIIHEDDDEDDRQNEQPCQRLCNPRRRVDSVVMLKFVDYKYFCFVFGCGVFS